MTKAMQQFIQTNRVKLVAHIMETVPNHGALSDGAIEDWINNDESLYTWARQEGALEED